MNLDIGVAYMPWSGEEEEEAWLNSSLMLAGGHAREWVLSSTFS